MDTARLLENLSSGFAHIHLVFLVMTHPGFLCLQTLEMASSQVKDSVAIVGPVHSAPHAAERVNQFIGPMPDLRKRKDERALDNAEEDYFNEERYDALLRPTCNASLISGSGSYGRYL